MRFTLIYTGPLKANARLDHKHELRKAFHIQLRSLWQQEPLRQNQGWFDGSQGIDLNRRIGSFRFVPLVSPDLSLICELRISMLKPEPPGALIAQGGDIDNRLKTLFDALRMPSTEDELPAGVVVEANEDPFFCLLEDDALITSVSLKTDRLLTPHQAPSEVHLDIQVETQPTRMVRGRTLVAGFTLI